MPRFAIRPSAWIEINAELEYLEEKAGPETSERMLDSIMSTIEVLAKTPDIGVRCGFTKQDTRRLRRWPIKGFESWLIFYQPILDGVEIVHVMHGSRDIAALLDV